MLAPNEALEAIKRRALEIQADIERKCGPYHAEIVPGVEAQWHVAATVNEAEAMKHASDRGFGTYIPSMEETKIVRGRKVNYLKKMFPGHIFLFVWDIKRHWRRIRACPGVWNVLCREEEPVVVPFAAVYEMQAIEFSGIEVFRPRRHRWRKRGQLARTEGQIVSVSPKSYWRGIETLDDDGRNRLLHETLGIKDAA